jgi:hypothetical protein
MLLLLVTFSGCVTLSRAYIPDSIITDGWHENTALRNTGSQFLGLEKWSSSTYEINGKYPASLTVTTLKSLILPDEEDLQNRITETIEETFQNRIQLNESIAGERTILKQHNTMYALYSGTDKIDGKNVKIIGEVWNCGSSGTSIICIGFSYITDADFPDIENTENWEKIVMDPQGTIEGIIGEEGLIYNIVCH